MWSSLCASGAGERHQLPSFNQRSRAARSLLLGFCLLGSPWGFAFKTIHHSVGVRPVLFATPQSGGLKPWRHSSFSPPALRRQQVTRWDAKRPVWEIKPQRAFRSIRDVRVGGGVPVAGDEGEESWSAEFFKDFKLTEASGGSASTSELGMAIRGLAWFLSLLWPHIAFGLLCSAIAQVLYTGEGPSSLLTSMFSQDVPDLQKIHGFVGTILGFTIGFRTNAAYDRFYEGRKILSTVMEGSRSIVRDAYSFLLKADGSGGDEEEVRWMCEDVRRRLDVLFAFIRQSVRESARGFGPYSGLADVEFSPSTYYLDTSRPQLVDLLTPAEAERYSHLSPRERVSALSGEISMILQVLGSRFHFVDAFVGKAQGHLNQILEAHSTMIRIRDTPLPYPYVIILSVATFLFVYATPFIYNAGPEGRYFGVQFLVLGFYGITQIGESIENPFAYDTFDIDLEAFAMNLHEDAAAIAKAHGKDRRRVLKDYFHSRDA